MLLCRRKVNVQFPVLDTGPVQALLRVWQSTFLKLNVVPGLKTQKLTVYKFIVYKFETEPSDDSFRAAQTPKDIATLSLEDYNPLQENTRDANSDYHTKDKLLGP